MSFAYGSFQNDRINTLRNDRNIQQSVSAAAVELVEKLFITADLNACNNNLFML